MALIDDIGEGPVGIDTAIFIYFIEEDTRYISTVAPLFEAADAGGIEIVTSALTLPEALIVSLYPIEPEISHRQNAAKLC